MTYHHRGEHEARHGENLTNRISAFVRDHLKSAANKGWNQLVHGTFMSDGKYDRKINNGERKVKKFFYIIRAQGR